VPVPSLIRSIDPWMSSAQVTTSWEPTVTLPPAKLLPPAGGGGGGGGAEGATLPPPPPQPASPSADATANAITHGRYQRPVIS